MLERIIHWIGKSRKKKCKSCCLRCEYWELCREEGFLSPEDVQKKYEGFLSPEQVQEKYKDYLSPEEVAKKDATIKSYETKSKRVEIALGAGLPYELAGKVSGETEEDMKKDAQTLAGFLKNNNPYPSYNPDPTGEESSKNEAMKKMLSNLGGN